MPELANRDAEEVAIAFPLAQMLAAAERRASQLDWSGLENRVRTLVGNRLEDIVSKSFDRMLPKAEREASADVRGARAAAFGAEQSAAVAALLIRNMQTELSAGRDLATVFSPNRAAVLAATEVTRATSRGEQIAREVLADPVVAIWITERDTRVCPICEPLHQRDESQWGAYAGGPPAHPNCRCHLIYRKLAERA